MKRTAALIACSILAAPAVAHHGFGRFDRNSEVAVEGTLTDRPKSDLESVGRIIMAKSLAKRMSFQDEFRAFLRRYEVEFDERYGCD